MKKKIKTKKYKLYFGDCYDVMKQLKDEIIDLTVTSPPYDNLRNYDKSLEWDYKIFKRIAKQIYRITKKGGILVWIVNDAVEKGTESGTSFKHALFFKKIGFRLHDTMIYEKPSFANPSRNRYHQVFEYMFIFSKGKPTTFNGIKDLPCKYAGKTSFGISSSRNKDGDMVKRKKTEIPKFGMRTNVWKMNTASNENVCKALPHPAMFPRAMAKDHIISWSNKGDKVFDPFLGSGTTGIQALKLKRKFIGIEKVKKYFKLAHSRIKNYKEEK